jgi:hypothetical protein
MPLADVMRESFERSFDLYRDLVAGLDAAALGSKLEAVPSNTLGAQLWCVVGARESYARAVAAGAWSGFSCSLTAPNDPSSVAASLHESEEAVRRVLAALDTDDNARGRLLVDLLEHETQHHGQLIRYLYGLRLGIPQSWRSRYALD